MKAFETIAHVEPNGALTLPQDVAEAVRLRKSVRVIVLFDDPSDVEEDAWKRVAAAAFLAGYDPADAIYDEGA